MSVTLLCTSPEHPVVPYLVDLIARSDVPMTLVHNVEELSGGDFLFLVSCSDFITAEMRARYSHCLVLHASDLPYGRGWSPHIWQIIEGATSLTVSLLEAADKIDAGRIWHKMTVPIDKLALYDEVNHQLFLTEIELIEHAIAHVDTIIPQEQSLDNLSESRYFDKRSPEDSELDINQSIKAQFNKMRVADNERFPSFFVIDGQKFYVKIEKSKS